MSTDRFRREQISFKPFILISLITVTALVMIYVSFLSGYQMTAKHSTLIDAAMEVKLETTLAHLWLEELLSGDRSESIDKVNAHLTEATWYAHSMLEGGVNSEGTFIALKHDSIRTVMNDVLAELGILRTLTNERYINFVSSTAGSMIDIKYDETFLRFVELTDTAETLLKSMVDEELSGFRKMHMLMAVFVVLIAFLIAFISWKHERQYISYLQVLHDIQNELASLSRTDQLTGLSNRRVFDETLKAEFNRAMRDRTSLTLIMIDVDYFKNYNDTYGHQEGDKCLKKVADTIANLCKRSLDVVTRYGGEEFAVILPNSENTLPLAKAMCEAVQMMGVPHESSGVANVVTISLGVAELVPSVGGNLEDLFKMADAALYKAKNNGRNQTVVNQNEA
jgi:diguanylate cyclase (GGDEF)-like protein